MAWTEWHHKVLPVTDLLAEIDCSLQAPDSQARSQSWSLSLDHFVRNPEIEVRGGLELMLFIEVGNLGFQVEDWRHIGRQQIVATPDWHARAEHIGAFGHVANTWLSVGVMEHDHGSGRLQRREWLADYFRITFSPPTGYLFPLELEAWLMNEEAFHTGQPLRGEEIRRIPTGPPNLRVIGLARFKRGRIAIETGHPDPIATARRRLAQTIRLDEFGDMSVKWWSETERSLKKQELPPPPGELRLSDVSFQTPVENPA